MAKSLTSRIAGIVIIAGLFFWIVHPQGVDFLPKYKAGAATPEQVAKCEEPDCGRIVLASADAPAPVTKTEHRSLIANCGEECAKKAAAILCFLKGGCS